MIGLVLCLFAAKFLFHVPFRGSVPVLTGVSMLYLLVALAHRAFDLIGGSRASLSPARSPCWLRFLPAVMLSGFLFDLRSMPAAVQFDHLYYCRRAIT